MAGLLEILIGADLKENSITDIKAKIDKLIAEYNKKEINLKLDTNEIDDVVNISQALSNLNQEIKKMGSKQDQILKSQQKASKALLDTTKKLMQDQLSQINKVKQAYGEVDRVVASTNKKGEQSLKITRKQNDYIKQSAKFTDGAKTGNQVDVNEGAFNKKMQSLKNSAKGMFDAKILPTEDIYAFQKSFKGLKIDSDNLNQRLKESNQIFQNLTNKANALANIDKQIVKAQQLLNQHTEEEIQKNQHLLNIKNQISNMRNFSNIEQGANNAQQQIQYLQEQKKRTDALTQSVKELNAEQKKQKAAEKKVGTTQNKLDNTLRNYNKNAQSLRDGGRLDPKEIKEYENSFKGLTAESDKLNEHLSRSQQHYKNLKDKAQALKNMESQIAKAMDVLNQHTDEEINDNQRLLAIKRQIANMRNFGNVESGQDIGKNNIKYLEEQKRKTDALKQSVKELNSATKEQARSGQAVQFKGNQGQELEGRLGQIGQIDNSSIAGMREQREQLKQWVADALRLEHGLQGVTSEMVQLKPVMNDHGQQIYRVITGYERADGELHEFIHTLNVSDRRLDYFNDNLRRTGSGFLDHLGRAVARMPAYMGAYEIMYGGIAAIRSGLTTIYEVDKAMTDLNKVADLTKEQFTGFIDVAEELGQRLGDTASNVIRATTEFVKLGYSLEQSTGLAEQSIMYANVGDMDVQTASTQLLATMKGFDVAMEDTVSEGQRYVDIFNEVGNNYAISSAGIGEALQRSAAIMHIAGNSIEESVALVTAANATIQNTEKVGTAMKTIVMRLQGVDESGEEIIGLMPELRGLFAQFDIDIMKSSKEMHNTFDIFDMLHEKWDSLTQLEQANFAEALGGKHQGAIVSAMMTNWDDAKNSLLSAQNAAGSAAREYEKYQESMQFRIGQLKNSMEEFWLTALDTQGLKNVISGLNSLVQGLTKLVDTTGIMPPLITLLIGGYILLNRELRTMLATGTTGVGLLVGEFTTLGAVVGAVGAKLKAFSLIMLRALGPLAIIYGITTIITILIEKFNEAKNAREDYLEGLKTQMDETRKFLQAMGQERSQDNPFNIDEYQKLETKERQGALDDTEYQKLHEWRVRIVDQFPEMIAGYDKEGNAVVKSGSELQRYIDLKKEQLNLDAQLIRQSVLDENAGGKTDTWQAKINPFDTDFEKMDKTSKEIDELKNKLKEFNDNTDQYTIKGDKLLSDQGLSLFKSNKQKYLTEMDGFFQQFHNLQLENEDDDFSLTVALSGMRASMDKGQLDEAEQYYNQVQLLMEKNRRAIQISIGEQEQDLANSSEAFNKYMQATYDVLSTGEGVDADDIEVLKTLRTSIEENFTDLEGTTAEKVDVMETLFTKMKTAAEGQDVDLGEIFTVGEEEVAIDFLENMLKGMKKNSKEAVVLTQMLQGLRRQATTQKDAAFDLEKWQQDAYDEYGSWLDTAGDLETAYRDVTSEQGLTLKGIYELIKEYPELAQHMEVQNGMLTLNGDGIKALSKIRGEFHKEQMEQDKLELQSAIDKAKTQLGGMLAVGKGMEQLADINRKSLTNLANERVEQYKAEIQRLGLTEKNLPKGVKSWDEMYKNYETYITGQFEPLAKMTDQLTAIEHLMNSVSGNYTNPIASHPSKEKEEKEKEKEVYISNKYKEALLEINKAMTEQNRIKGQYGKFSKQYRDALEREIELIEEKKKWTDAELASVREQLRTGKYITYGNVKESEAVYPTAGTSPSASYSAPARPKTYSGQYATEINRYASQYGVDPFLIAAVIQQESSFNRTAVSPAGARGLMQLMPATGNSLGVYGNEFFDAGKNIEAGTRYLSQQIKAFGSISLGLAAYNAGPGNVRKYGGIPPFKETQNYVARITSAYGSGGGGTYSASGGGGGGGGGTVRYGARGEAVKEIQRAVGVAVDGIFGSKTLAAVKRFQSQMGLAVDGIVGSQTWAKIRGGGGGGTATASGGGGGGMPTLRYGSRGESVKELQRLMKVQVDGIFGPKTQAAVKNFQRSVGIASDGIVGAITWGKLGKGGGGGGAATGGGGSGYTGPTPTLRVGSRGEAVKAVQRVVGVAVDGIFGPKTLAAVKKFQQQMGIAVDGIVGSQTWAKIKGAGGGGGGAATGAKPAMSEEEMAVRELEADLLERRNQEDEEKRGVVLELLNASFAKQQSDIDLLAEELAKADWGAESATGTETKGRFLEESQRVIEQQRKLNQEGIDELMRYYNKYLPAMNEELRAEAQKIIQDRQLQDLNYLKELNAKAKEIVDNAMASFDIDFGSDYQILEDYVKDLERRLNTIDKEDNPKEYLDILNKQRFAQQKQRDLITQQLGKLEELKEKYKGNAVIVDYIDEKIRETTEKWKDMGDTIFETGEKIKEAYKDLADEMVDLYKDTLESRKEGELKTIEEVSRAEREAHDERMEQLDDELKKMDEMYAKELENLDKTESERSYQAQLGEYQEQRQKLVDELGLLSVDTTIEGRANRKRLEEELSNIDKQIEEHQRARELELTRQAITEEQEDRRENIENQKQEAQEVLDVNEEAREKEREDIEKRYAELLNDEKYFNQLREEIIAGHMNNMTSEFTTAATAMGQYSEELGNNLTTNFIDKLKEANEQMAIYGSMSTSLPSADDLGIGLMNPDIQNMSFGNLDVSDYTKNPLYQMLLKNMVLDKPVQVTLPDLLQRRLENWADQIKIEFNIGTVENGIDTANDLYEQFIKNMKLRGVIV